MSTTDEVKQRLDIVSVIGGYVPLTKAGRNFKANCPFHQEKTPSFYVFPETQTWRCFGSCAVGGDLFSFVMKREGIDFGEALRQLAARAGVELQERRRESPQEDEHLNRLKEAMQAASLFFHNQLLSAPGGAAARKYVEGRAISQDSVRRFMLGYGPSGWQALRNHLTAQGYSDAELLEAGLVIEGDTGVHDRFRNRLMFPINDLDGAVIAFGGRSLDAETHPKYMTSPQPPLFDKSGTVYALHLARETIRQRRQAVIVEGYMDALMAHQHGYTNVVASMGTSLTERQVSLLSRYAPSLVLALDADAAGQAATLRGLEVAPEATGEETTAVPSWQGRVRRKQVGGKQVFTKLPEGTFRTAGRQKGEIRVLRLPEGKDPDELVRKDPSRWEGLVEGSVPMLDFLFTAARERFDLSTVEGKSDAAQNIVPFLVGIPSKVEQAQYVQRLATLSSVSDEIIWRMIGEKERSKKGRQETAAGSELQQHLQQLDVLEDYCLALLLTFDYLAEDAQTLQPDHFLATESKELLKLWRTQGSEGVGQADEFLQPRLERVKEVHLPPMAESMARLALAQCIHRLEERRLRELKMQQRLQLAEDEADQGVTALAVAAYERWKETNRPDRELLVNQHLQELMTQRSPEER